MAKKNRIRVIVLGVFCNNNRILVFEGHDSVKNENFFRPLGGAVEFGETAEEALMREIREEISAEITDLHYIGMLENIFTFDGKEGHEIVLIFDAKFIDTSLYAKNGIKVNEDNKYEFKATWLDLDKVDPSSMRLYPDGLHELLKSKLSTKEDNHVEGI